MMKQAFLALKGRLGRNKVEVTEWAFDRIKEAFERVAKDEARKLSTVQEVKIRSTDYLRRIIAPAGEQGGVTMSCFCPYCNSFPLEDYVWWAQEKSTHWWCAICGENSDRREPCRLLVVQRGESVYQAKVFRAHAVPRAYVRI